jgi:S-adenosylmethionine:tRNA ribosyltransferase-isomerase
MPPVGYMLPAAQNGKQGEDPLALYDYDLPPGRIAQSPAPKRVQAKLMVLPLDGGMLSHAKVAGLPKLLRPGDLLVLNQTQVVPARMAAQKATGGKVEIFLLDPVHPRVRRPGGTEEVEALIKSHRPVKPGMRLELGSGEAKVRVTVLERGEKGKVWLETPCRLFRWPWSTAAPPCPRISSAPKAPVLMMCGVTSAYTPPNPGRWRHRPRGCISAPSCFWR